MGSGPISTTLVPPADDPPAGPRVKNQTLPPDPTANPYGPVAASACASVGKFSNRQKSGLAGNCETFFSVSALVTSTCCAVAVADSRNNPVPMAASILMRRGFMGNTSSPVDRYVFNTLSSSTYTDQSLLLEYGNG